MDSIQVMMNEHEQILGVLEALEQFVADVRQTPEDQLELERFVTFIREYADERHHGRRSRSCSRRWPATASRPSRGPSG
jgi:hemerythrin-like domain-containing protein